MEEQNKGRNEGVERRSEPRMIIEEYCSVEFSISRLEPAYQFRIREMSSSGMGILVKEDSALLKPLSVGDILNLKYNPVDPLDPPEYLKTEIKHITKDEHGRFRGHYFVGLSILGKQNQQNSNSS